ncbi:MAG: response regulator transcription factor [Phycisphaerales bacterium]|nr:response regulator transcription factor [Phycisphaerales bacterium]
MSKIDVMIVDDHAMVRSGLKMLIDGQPDMRVCAEAGSLREALERVVRARPRVVTLDLSMPGSQGASGVEKLRKAAPDARVLVLTMHDDPAYVRAAVATGAAGYVVKSAADAELITAIRAVAHGGVFVGVKSANSLGELLTPSPRAERTPLESLSAREREVLVAVAKGYTNQQIADRASLSVKTVESYRSRLMTKLGLGSRADITRLAVESGLLAPGDTP